MIQESYYHTLAYQAGPLTGWMLCPIEDWWEGQNMHVGLCQYKKSTFEWEFAGDGRGRYHIKIARGPYKGYFLTDFQTKNKNVGFLYVTKTQYQESLWKVETSQKFNYDKSKRIITNYQTDRYLRVAKQKKYQKPGQQCFRPHLTKGASGLGDGMWRIQTTTQTDQLLQRSTNSEQKISDYQDKYTKLYNNKIYYKNLCQNMANRLKNNQVELQNKINALQKQNKYFSEQNAQLEYREGEAKKWQILVQQKETQLQVIKEQFQLACKDVDRSIAQYEKDVKEGREIIQKKKLKLDEYREKLNQLNNIQEYDVAKFSGEMFQLMMSIRKQLQDEIYKIEQNQSSINFTYTYKVHSQLKRTIDRLQKEADRNQTLDIQDKKYVQLYSNYLKKQEGLNEIKNNILQRENKFNEEWNILQNQKKQNNKNLLISQSEIKFLDNTNSKLRLKFKYFKELYLEQNNKHRQEAGDHQNQVDIESLRQKKQELRQLLKAKYGVQLQQQEQVNTVDVNSLIDYFLTFNPVNTENVSKSDYSERLKEDSQANDNSNIAEGLATLFSQKENIPQQQNLFDLFFKKEDENAQRQNINDFLANFGAGKEQQKKQSDSAEDNIFNKKNEVYSKMMGTKNEDLFEMDDLEVQFEYFFKQKANLEGKFEESPKQKVAKGFLKMRSDLQNRVREAKALYDYEQDVKMGMYANLQLFRSQYGCRFGQYNYQQQQERVNPYEVIEKYYQNINLCYSESI